jgi:hypothetical protein
MPSYTAIGGKKRAAFSGLSAVILSRGSRYPRRTLFQELEKVGFDYIISIEGDHERYNIDELSNRFPSVSFIFLKDRISTGEQINLAVAELSSPLFFVLWNDLRILHSGGALRMAERLMVNPGSYRRLCTVPIMQTSHFETLPTIAVPMKYQSRVKPLFFEPHRDGESSLYPFDGVGIYDRSRFVSLGGFDSTLKNNYWQLMDFGFRAHLWGENINLSTLIRLSYDGEIPLEDSTADNDARRFYLKNLAPVFRGDNAIISLRKFPSYWWRSGRGFLNAWEEFSQARRWVKVNSLRFKNDAGAVIELWDDMTNRPDPEPVIAVPETLPLNIPVAPPVVEAHPTSEPVSRSGS